MRIEMPERHEQVHMTVEPHGPLATSALVALNLVSVFKAEKLSVGNGPVTIAEPFTCSERHGEEMRAEIKHHAERYGR